VEKNLCEKIFPASRTNPYICEPQKFFTQKRERNKHSQRIREKTMPCVGSFAGKPSQQVAQTITMFYLVHENIKQLCHVKF
jgi:hypothetical protein